MFLLAAAAVLVYRQSIVVQLIFWKKQQRGVVFIVAEVIDKVFVFINMLYSVLHVTSLVAY